MYDLIYYNPLTNPMSKPAGKGDKSSDTASVSSAKTNQSRSSGSVKSESSGSVKAVKSETTDAVTGPVPQLKLDANGEIILDEKSLVIETTGDKEAREMLANSDVVYDDEFSGSKFPQEMILLFCIFQNSFSLCSYSFHNSRPTTFCPIELI